MRTLNTRGTTKIDKVTAIEKGARKESKTKDCFGCDIIPSTLMAYGKRDIENCCKIEQGLTQMRTNEISRQRRRTAGDGGDVSGKDFGFGGGAAVAMSGGGAAARAQHERG